MPIDIVGYWCYYAARLPFETVPEVRSEKRRHGHVYRTRTNFEPLLSNADLPGMLYGWGVGMYVSAP